MSNQPNNVKYINTEKYDGFQFSKENIIEIQKIIAQYPKTKKSSAVMPLLHLAQRQNGGFLNKEALNCIADILDIPIMNVYEVAKFYSMYNLSSVGKYCIQVCRTTPCWLRGSEILLKKCKEILNINLGDTTQDNLFTLKEVECLGACTNAPVVQINDDYYENLTPEMITDIISNIKKIYK